MRGIHRAAWALTAPLVSVACTYVSPLTFAFVFRFFRFVNFRLLYLFCLSCYTLGRHERRGLFVTLLLFIVDPLGYRGVLLLCHSYRPAHAFV